VAHLFENAFELFSGPSFSTANGFVLNISKKFFTYGEGAISSWSWENYLDARLEGAGSAAGEKLELVMEALDAPTQRRRRHWISALEPEGSFFQTVESFSLQSI